jgi:hypothetical protein
MNLLLRALIVVTLLAAANAGAQCQPSATPFGWTGPDYATVSTMWDPDGDGPEPPRLVVFARTQSAWSILMWTGQSWRSLASNVTGGSNGVDDGPVQALLSWDPDGDGPLPPLLIAAGIFQSIDGVACNNVAAWDGQSWRPLGTGTDLGIYTATTWDPDGAGPQPPLLILGGFFRNAGGAAADYIAAWDGANFSNLGWSFDGPVNSLAVCDPDGNGAQLFAGGSFIHSGADGVGQFVVNNVARWDGVRWYALGEGLSSSNPGGYAQVQLLATWDPDGDGPLRPRLVCFGGFGQASANGSATPVVNAAAWDGAMWQPLGEGLPEDAAHNYFSPYSAVTWNDQLLLSGRAGVAGNQLHAWNGSIWTQVGPAPPPGWGYSPTSHVITWRPTPSSEPQLLLTGFFHIGNPYADGVIAGDLTTWTGFSTALNAPVHALAQWDPDGNGPLPPLLVAGGEFTATSAANADYVAYWAGERWMPFGWGTDGPVNAVISWDPDGDGPLPPQLIIAGNFSNVGSDSTGAIPAANIARWDGAAWQPLGSGLDGPVRALLSWDPDGPGPLPPLLIVAGDFTHAGGLWSGSIAAWDGTTWHRLGWGLDAPTKAITTWDADGPGPLPPRLIAAGDFLYAGADATGGVLVNRIAMWDGSTWQAFGDGFATTVATTLAFDFDGLGSARLLAGGDFGLKRWSGAQWEDFGDGFYFGAYVDPSGFEGPYPEDQCTGGGYFSFHGVPAVLGSWDPDGPGPTPPKLYSSGSFTFQDGQCCNYEGGCYGCGCLLTYHFVARLEQDSFAPISFLPDAQCFATDAAGNLVMGSATSPYVFRERPYAPAMITTQPQPFVAHRNDTATFAVSASNAVAYHWYRYGPNLSDFDALEDGADWPYGGTVSGSHTPQLSIAFVLPIEAGLLRCEISQEDCTTIVSDAASLTIIPGACTADFNHDGSAGTDADIEDFFRCLAGSCCPTCGDIDFNGDGAVATDADIESFFRVLAGGPC